MKRLFAVVIAGVFVFAAYLLFTSASRQSQNSAAPNATAQEKSNSSGALAGNRFAATNPASSAVAAVPQVSATGAVGSTSPTPLPSGPPRKRAWDPQFFSSLNRTAVGDPIRFELMPGEWASGTVQHAEHKGDELIYISGVLTEPEAGRFFFQKQTRAGKAGDFAGVIEFAKSERAYRLEPTGINGATELVEHSLKEVLCLKMPEQANPGDVEEIPPLKPNDFPTVPIPDYQNGIIVLESLPGSRPVLYMDFQGGYTPTWGGIAYERPNVSNAQIRDVWVRVAEDYMPFNINVTTDLKVYQNAPEGSRQRVILTPTTTAAPGAGGVAYVGSFNWTGDTPCWAFYASGKNAAEVVAHEVGHTLGLSHDTQDAAGQAHVEYYTGHGSGDTGWAPIMGAGYYQNVTQWSKGEYIDASQFQDDIAMISGNNNDVAYRADDTGDTLAASRYLELYPGNAASAQGVIETTGDTDAFQFTTTGGLVSLRADPVAAGPDLALQVTLFDANDVMIASNNPQTTLWASVSKSVVAGTYTLRVTGVGRNNPLNSGFSPYASLGYYSVTGSVANARMPSRFVIPENSANGTLVGVVPANNPGGDPLIYTITGGNTGNTFALDANGNLTVADNSLLDYEALALNTQLPVQFEMFVDIENTVNASLNETNRRVVVAITNVNEAPVLAGFTNSVLEHTQPGTVLGTVTGSDPDFYTLLSYSITDGNSSNLFAIDSRSGAISVAGDLTASLATETAYTLTVVASDQATPISLTATSTVVINVLPNNTPYRPGSISYAIYTNITGTTVATLTGSASYPTSPAFEKQLASFEGDTDRDDNFGAVIRGYVIPPATGSYTFWIASDDDSQLFLSSSTNPAAILQIASVSGWTNPREWTKYSSQKSAARALTAGQGYYVEVRMKEGTGGDNLAVAWQCNSAGITGTNVIPGTYLAPYFLNYKPRAAGFTTALHKDAIIGARVGTVTFTDINANDTHRFSIVSGNSGNVFSIETNSGIVRVASEAALLATGVATFNLGINVTDSGKPPLTGTATAVVSIVASNAITATSLRQEVWTNAGTSVAVTGLTSLAKYPKRPDLLLVISNFDGVQSFGDNYGSRIRGYVTPASSGSFRFFVASDDNSQLKFSNTTNAAAAGVVASVVGTSGWTDYGVWNKFASQTSPAYSLSAGQKCYLETLQKEGGGGDHVEAGWSGPGLTGTNIIAASFLSPVDLNYAPDLANRVVSVPFTATNGFVVTTLTASDSALDQITYKIIGGNTNGTFAIDPDTGRLTVVSNATIAANLVPSFLLRVQAQDSGYGDLYPRKSTNITVTVQFTETAAFTWTGNGTNDNWSEGANWNGAAPIDSSRLIFTGTNRSTNFNDILTVVGSVAINNGGFQLAGNPLALRADVTSTGDNVWAVDSTLTHPMTINNVSGTLTWSGALDNGGNRLTLLANNAILMDGVLSGTGALVKSGAGTVTVSAAGTLTGPVTNTAGTLALTGAGSLSSSPQLHVMSGAVLDVLGLSGGLIIPSGQILSGDGLIRGNVLVNGTLSPGGTLNFENGLGLAGTTLIEINKTGSVLTNDLVNAAGILTFGGALSVTNTGDPLAAGDTFNLFDASSFAGSFAAVTLPVVDAGLFWNTATLATDGTIRVAVVPTPQIQVGPWNGSTLTLQFQSTEGVSYLLQSSTNLASPIIWSDVSTNSGTGGLLTVPAPTNPEEEMKFFRLLAY